ncbi:uncharacterized protein LOC115329089 [Ixodes scapularis]|uniref:uncharacterized protein LOC115329089 n=1 Tax=Ixodes scapularis TaxID=6945 RepID=UPI001A9F5C29|nr:uncharacterized protein LOC115329089 [Ixodes scapularis]XP_040358315.1 uncharacterized protein LOC115329089 [Ixodes scapularis]XP_040358316.1 uncharacterized protein LOC115329089 [Ixodes scapularis]
MRPPDYYKLKLQLSWLRKDTDRDDSSFLRAYREFFSNHSLALCGSPDAFQLSEVYKKSTNSLYEEDIYQVDCIFDLELTGARFSAHTRYLQVGQLWCFAGQERRGVFHWLTPHPLEAFEQATHPADRDVRLVSLSFGTLVGLETFVEHHIFNGRMVDDHRDYRLKANFQHDQRMLHVDLHLNHKAGCGEKVTEYRFVVPYLNILKVLVNEKRRYVELFLHLKIPSMLMGEVRSEQEKQPSNQFVPLRWERYLSFGCTCLGGRFRVGTLCGGLLLKLVTRDRSLAYRVLGRLSQRCSHGVTFSFCPVRTYCPGKAGHDRTHAVHCRCESMLEQLPFPCAYAFKAVLNITFDVRDQMMLLQESLFESLMKLIEERAKVNPGAVERALNNIVSSIDAGNVVLFTRAFDAVYASTRDEKPPQLARGTCLVRSVFFTPGRLILRPAQVHFENRVLRQFNAEFAIRASFRDDNMEKLSFTLHLHSSRDDILDVVVGRAMREGLRVGSREFKFLAPSTSQLRDHGTWMYAVDEQQNTAGTIRDWMGRFDGIPNVAKRMARMGQCFSSTEQAVLVRKHEVRMVPDMEGGAHPVSRKPYVFSDGVGMMSVPLAQEVYKVMKLKERPSAIQIRYAGAKGMLCINPELPNQKLLYLRPSMQKFPCTSSDYLEVVKVSAPRSVTLNRPLITILEQLGVPADVFIRLQDDMILEFTDALVCERNAVEMLSSWAKLALPFQDLTRAGFQLTLDPFFRSLLLAVYRNAVAGLRYKTRIALPVDRARNMLGVVDTTGVLRYGQVFVQCSEMGARASQQGPPKCRVITGQVLVTKCPCLHPGDVRKFTAIDEPRLHHVVDCIVFPGQGHRPHPDEMAGSDLDGDEYIVIWEPSLLFPGYNKQPMNFSDRNPEPERGEITINDMIQFLCNYIKNDSIGILSNAHLAWADQEEEGIYSRRCLAIAEKISICLDFAKSGRTAYLRREERPMFYPDFMEKGSHKISYRSDRVLGLLYRTCRSLEAAVGSLGHRHVDAGRCLALDVPGWQRYKSAALAALADYNTRLRRILNQYGIASEGEAMACMVSTYDTYHNAQSDKLNMEDLVEKMTKFLTETTREVFFSELLTELKEEGLEDEEEERTRRKMQKASAWYMVTYSPDRPNTGLFSFPWCVADVLVEVLRRATHEQKRWCPDVLSKKIDDLIENNAVPAEGGNDAFWVAYVIIERWLRGETLLGQSTDGKPGLCKGCLLKVYEDFLSSQKLSWSLSSACGKDMQLHEAKITEVAEEKSEGEGNFTGALLCTKKECLVERCIPGDGPGDVGAIGGNLDANCYDGPLAQIGQDGDCKSCPTFSKTQQNPREASPSLNSVISSSMQDFDEDAGSIGKPKSSAAPKDGDKNRGVEAAPKLGSPPSKDEPSAGTLVVRFLRWCLEHLELPKELCPHNVCSGGGYEGHRQTHRLPMVALRTYSSLAVSLDPCHLGLPCDPTLHEPHQEVTERDPVRIPIANPAFHRKLKENMDEVRELLKRWTGVQDVHIQWQEDGGSYIVVTSMGRDWQIWYLEELLMQRWLPQAIDKGSLDEFLVVKGACQQ